MKRLLIGAIVFMIGLSHAAGAAEQINWLVINYPPAYIISGSAKGAGFSDMTQTVLQRNLPEYQHASIEVTVPRMLAFLNDPTAIYCTPSMPMLAEQHPNLHFSTIASLVPPTGIVIRKAEQDRFINAPNQAVLLEKLFQTPTLTAGIVQEGQYGKQIVPLIQKYATNPNLYFRTNINQNEFYRMLFAHRIDYVLEYAFAFFLIRQTFAPDEQAQLTFLPVIEESKAEPVYVICNQTPASQAVMSKINTILLTDAYKTAVAQRMIEFLPENLREEYLKLNLDMIGK